MFTDDLYFILLNLYNNLYINYSFFFALYFSDLTLSTLIEMDNWNLDVIISLFSIYNTAYTNEDILNWLEDLQITEFSSNFSLLQIFAINYSDLIFYQSTEFLIKNQPLSTLFLPEFIERLIKNKIIVSLVITNFISFYLKEKILYFFLINFFLIFFMLLSIKKLYSSTNLIYALLHFLVFAVLSGLLIIFWGSLYLGFCVLLIYGAAIPVLALYIIMLVNVDLIQRLFFFEHINKIKFTSYKKKIILTILLSFYFLNCFKDINYFLIELEQPLLTEFYTNLNYLFLIKRQFLLLNYSFGTTSIYDLALSFYSSDLDKVASAAFKTSYNELFALVFLLLIAIIVVISISRSSYISTNITTLMLQEHLPKMLEKKYFDFYLYRNIMNIY
jgi:hypothetical protein